jgi:hypothetical protein
MDLCTRKARSEEADRAFFSEKLIFETSDAEGARSCCVIRLLIVWAIFFYLLG